MSYELMFQKALNLQQNGALNEAEQIYRQILETAPKNADVLNLLGLIAQQRCFHQEAVSYFYRAADSAPNHFPIFFNLAVSLEALNRHLEALEAYAKALQLKPQTKEAHFGRANIFWHIGNKTEAQKEYEAAIAIDTDYAEARANLAEMNDDETELENLRLKYPRCAAIFYYLGRRKFAAEHYDNAKKYLSIADELLTSDEIKTMLALSMLHGTDEPSKALTLFYGAVELNPHNVPAMLQIADYQADKGNFPEAEKFYKKAIEIEPQNLSAHTNYAGMLCKNKRTLEALEDYRSAVLIAPETPEISYNLAQILSELKDYEQALLLMFNAFYLAPEHEDWSINIAETLALFNKTEPEKAKKIAQNWLEKMPDNPIARHSWAAINGEICPDDAEYNRRLFNVFAATYEETLERINYQAAKKVAAVCGKCKGKILDLGCGSGLLGVALKTKENKLTGIDISEQMLKLAAQKNVYDKLINDEIGNFLQNNHTHFDLITAADVLCYFGDLTPIFKLCYPTEFVFSIEADEQTETFVRQANGRCKHNPKHVKNLLKTIGYTKVTCKQTILRTEDGEDVAGMIFKAE